MPTIARVLLLPLLACLIASCGDDEGGGEEAPATVCEYLGATCHDKDDACHEVGHDGDETVCNSMLAACLPKCESSSCDFLSSFCHDRDDTCHDVGHDGDAATCDTQLADCAMTCDQG